MTEYLVTWSIDVSADTPEEAAQQARAIQIDPDTTATVFEVYAPYAGPDAGTCTVVDVQDLPPVLPADVVEGIEHGLSVLASLTDGEHVARDDIYRAANALAATLGR